jgi:hypothetical protein
MDGVTNIYNTTYNVINNKEISNYLKRINNLLNQ